MKKTTYATTLLLAFLLTASPLLAATGDWKIEKETATSTQSIAVPARNSIWNGVLGGEPSGTEPVWYHLADEEFNVDPEGTGYKVTLNAFQVPVLAELRDRVDFMSEHKMNVSDASEFIQSMQDKVDVFTSIFEAYRQSDWDITDDTFAGYIANKPIIPDAQIQSDWNQASTTALDFIANKPTIPAAQVQSSWTATSGPALILDKPSIPTVLPMSVATSSRTVGTGFQPSATRDSTVRFTVSVANVLTLSGGAAGDFVVETSATSTFASPMEQGRFGNSNTGGLVVGLTLNDAIKGQVSADVPAGHYVRIRTVTTTGTPTYSLLGTVETLR